MTSSITSQQDHSKFQGVCFLAPSKFELWLRNSTAAKRRSWAMFPDNLSAIGAVLTEIRPSGRGRVGVVCWSSQAWAYSQTELLRLRASQESFSRPNEATLELPDCCKTFLGPLGTFYTWFHGRKTRISWDLLNNMTFPVADFRRQSNSLIYFEIRLPEN